MEFSKPGPQHRFLERLLGEWVVTSSAHHPGYDADDPDKQWRETVRTLGGIWFVAESGGLMPNGERGQMMITLGFDAKAGRYVGSWVGSMMDTLWLYSGWVEPDGNTLILEAEGPSFSDPSKTELYRDTITFLDADHRRFTGAVRQADGTFKEFMRDDMKRLR